MKSEQEIQELKEDLEYFEAKQRLRELNSFEKGIKEEIERLLNE